MRCGRRGLVCAVGREQQDRPVVRGCARGRRRDRASTCRPSADPRARAARVPRRRASVSSASVSSNTRSCEPRRSSTGRGSPSGRRASTNGWYGSSVPTRSIERPRRTSNPASRARLASSEASRVLPMPASPATRTVAPLPARAASSARSSSPSSRARPTNTSLARATFRPVSRSSRGAETQRQAAARKIRRSARCAPACSRPRSVATDDTRRHEMTAVARTGRRRRG